MANKNRVYDLEFCFKSEGNRAERRTHRVSATTVQRAISKLAKDITEGKWDGDIPDAENANDDIRPADLLVISATTDTK